METNLEEYWSDLRNGVLEEGEQADDILSLAVLHRWAQDLHNPKRPSFLVVSGVNRDRVYQRFQFEEWMFDEPGVVNDICGPATNAWVGEGLVKHFTNRIQGLQIPPEYRNKSTFMLPLPEPKSVQWEVLWGLIACSFLVVEDPLDQLVDKRFSLLSDAHRMILEARFEVLEKKGESVLQNAIQTTGKWIEGHRFATLTDSEKAFLQRAQVSQAVTEAERFEVILFILSLARQNGVVGGIVLALDGLEEVVDKGRAEELFKLLEITERWTKLGSPLGILLGWRGTKDDCRRLTKLHPRLAKRVLQADAWIRRESEDEG